MKRIALIIATLLSTFSFTYAANDDIVLYAKAQSFAADYEKELRQKRLMDEISKKKISEKSLPMHDYGEKPKNDWEFDARFKPSGVIYKEKESGSKSDFAVFYPELSFSVSKRFKYDIPVYIDLSLGQSFTGKETWYIDGLRYQTNDLDIFRLGIAVK